MLTSKLELTKNEYSFGVDAAGELAQALAPKGEATAALKPSTGTVPITDEALTGTVPVGGAAVPVGGAAVPVGGATVGTDQAGGGRWGAEVIGQPRALEALKLGVRVRSKGYNVYVSGAPGTGRRTAVLRVLADEPEGIERLRDIAYVYDFDAPLAPKVLLLDAGKGREFKRDLHHLVEDIKSLVALQAESEERKRAEAEMTAALEAEENRGLAEFEAELAADGFRAVQVEAEGGEGGGTMDIVPLIRRVSEEPESVGIDGLNAPRPAPADAASDAATPEAASSTAVSLSASPTRILGSRGAKHSAVELGAAIGDSTAPAADPLVPEIAASNADSATAVESSVQAPAPETASATSDTATFEETSFEALQDLVTSGQLPEEAYNALRERWYGHMDKMKRLFSNLRRGRRDLQARLVKARDEALKPQVLAETSILRERWKVTAVSAWLASLETDLAERLYLFRAAPEGHERKRRSPALARYGVNLVVDRSGTVRAPVVIENHPTASNLFGFVEPRPEDENDTRSAYLRIRAGSFLQAAGGFLVLRAEDVLVDEEAWLRLKRALQDGFVEIQPRESPFGAAAWLKPEAIKADVKVVMVGGEGTYDALYQADPDFQKLFKVHAEFDATMPRSALGLRDYAAFVAKIVEEEGLLPATADGLAAVIEQGIRLSEYRGRLSTRFGLVADLLREADYRAKSDGRNLIDAAAVEGAVATRARLANLPEEKLEEMISGGEIILQASGLALGRLNGLAVHDRGYYAFGLPIVVSAQVSPGEGGVINIEGESGLSGEIYDKAVLIMEGFLRSRYARDFPLAVTASICFEQSYTAVEGDSASSTAVYALLSAIACLPLRQDVAVTGSLNQTGQVQPVGGINEKIEGFYRVCRQAGFTGTQGVMIPRRNVVNLTLSRELQTALDEGRFHIWAVSTVDEGIEVLSGIEAGVANERGDFPADSFNGRVRHELQRMAAAVKKYQG